MTEPQSDAPPDIRTHRRVLLACREAVHTAFGRPALDAVVARLPEDVRLSTADARGLSEEWLPSEHFLAWHQAVWEGPARRSIEELERWTRTRTDYAFGPVRRALVRLATTSMLAERTPKLWRQDHTHGTLSVDLSDRSATVTLSDHPFTEHLLARTALSEVWRHAISLLGYRDVRKRHWCEHGRFVTRVFWHE